MNIRLNHEQALYPYTLKQIQDICGIDSIHTARKYLHEVLPSYEREGHGKGARYSENTLNSFHFVMLLKEKQVLALDQIKAVMAELGQEQINRVIEGIEPLQIGIALEDAKGRLTFPAGSTNDSGEEKAIIVRGTRAETIKNPLRESASASRGQTAKAGVDWHRMPISNRLELRYKGSLSNAQREELAVAARILKSIVES